MNRRQAIRQIIIVSSGLAVLPACDFQGSNGLVKTYEHLALSKKQYTLIGELQKSILPLKEVSVDLASQRLDYLLTRINDCYSMEDIQQYLSGLGDFEQYMTKQFDKPYAKLEPAQKTETLELIAKDKQASNMQTFINTNKALTVEHFTRSEQYQTDHFGFEFAPNRYSGCVAI